MAIYAKVEDGKLQYDYTDSSKKKTTPKGSDLGYDEFLQLLCAEMQYQDPLEPTNNTDYVAQLATFSQLEATLGMKETESNSMANNLVGKHVIMKVTNESTGATNYVDGKCDYVMYQDGKTYLSVNNALYPLEDLDTVSDSEYYEAMGLAKTFTNMVDALPDLDHIKLESKDMIESVRKVYDNMTEYQKKYVQNKDLVNLVTKEARLKELIKAKEEADANADAAPGEAESESNSSEAKDSTASEA